MRKRTTWLFLIFALLYLGVAARLARVQVIENNEYRKWAERIRSRDIEIAADRGSICDRNGAVLAVNVETASVFANLKEVKDSSRTAARVAALLGKGPQAVEARLNSDRDFVWLGRQLDAGIGDRVWKMRGKIPGIGMQRDTKRVYPVGQLAAQIIGFTNIDNNGVEGIECVCNKALAGRAGLMRAELDSERRVIPETRHQVREPEHGDDVHLTIDVTIQHIAERALARMAAAYHPRHACAIVMDPRTGEILALANYPTYDPNKARSTPAELWRNRAVADLYEPGSTLKAVTVAAALNEGISPHAVVACCTGREGVGHGHIECSLHHPYEAGHGGVDMYKIIRYSCNIGAAQLAFRLGDKKLRKYEQAFGLMDKTDAGFGCEAVGLPLPKDDWGLMRLANVGFGQGMAVTPLQMACVYSTIANGGVYVQPRIVRRIVSADDSLCRVGKPVHKRRVISREAAAELAKMLAGCVDEGTGKNSQIDGRTVAGKTGSAQVARTDGRGYEPGAFVASFMGFVPAYQPRLTIVVVVNRPQGSHWGATVAAPVFKEIGEKALWYLRVPSDAPTDRERDQRDGKRLV